MKAWIGEDGFIHVAAENAAERFAMQFILETHSELHAAAVYHAQEPVDSDAAAG